MFHFWAGLPWPGHSYAVFYHKPENWQEMDLSWAVYLKFEAFKTITKSTFYHPNNAGAKYLLCCNSKMISLGFPAFDILLKWKSNDNDIERQIWFLCHIDFQWYHIQQQSDIIFDITLPKYTTDATEHHLPHVRIGDPSLGFLYLVRFLDAHLGPIGPYFRSIWVQVVQ